VSGAPIDHVALVVLRALGSVTADGLSEQAQAELDALVSGQVVKTGLAERGTQTGDPSVAGPNTRSGAAATGPAATAVNGPDFLPTGNSARSVPTRRGDRIGTTDAPSRI